MSTKLKTIALAALGLTFVQKARGDGVSAVLTAKTLPAATISVIDPESGTSSGGGTTDVNVGVGDIILFKFKYFPVPDKIVHGLQGYLTEYVPPNTQVVGVRFTDANEVTVVPNYPGLATNGCGRPCSGFNTVPSATGDRNLADGSIAQLYSDTGIFYTTDTRLTRNPGTEFLSFSNGVLMSPEPNLVNSVSGILGTSAPFYAHNAWDWIQVQGFGTNVAFAENNGTGNTPFRYGSPVAGPQTYYTFEATQAAPGDIEFNDTVGPWQRVAYPGSQIGSGAAVTGSGPLQRMNVATATGADVTPLNPMPVGTKAVRYAGGEVRVGEPLFAEIAVRVLATPIDPVQARDVDCAETFGGDTSAASATVRAKDNPWSVYLGSPACVFLNLLFEVTVDLPLALGSDVLTYTVHGKNLSINPQTNAIPRLRYDSTRMTYIAGSATGAGVDLPTCDDGSGGSCIRWPAMTLLPSDEYTFTAQFDVGGGGQVTSVVTANYRSDQLVAPGYSTQAISMIKTVAVVGATLAPTTVTPLPGGTVAFSGTISNAGSGAGSYDTVTILLPAGWTVTGAVTLGAVTLTCASGCAGSIPTYNISSSFPGPSSRVFTFTASIPGGTATGLYPVDLQIWGSQTAFGGSFETYFPKIALAPVGQPRSTPPVLTCPINKADTTIFGTTVEADGTVIRLYFNLIQRASGLSAAGAFGVTGFVPTFGNLYGGLEVRGTAQAPGELESLLSTPCVVTNVPACADFMDNDGDGLTDFPADPGCDAPTDNTEFNSNECIDGIDNDGDALTDYPDDPSCSSPSDSSETAECADGLDNDGDGVTDLADANCASAADEVEAPADVCGDGVDNDTDGFIDFPADVGCHSTNDDFENNLVPNSEVKARLLIVFDTSGSMNWNTCANVFTGGDGSVECAGADVTCATCPSGTCGNGVADDSRLYKVKAGLSDVVAAFGEVDYGLMRFHQREVDFVCPGQNASLSSGTWQGGGGAPCSGGFAAGDLLVSFSPTNQYDLIEWMDGQDNFVGVPPAGLDIELRGSGTTPLAGSLNSALDYLTPVRAADPVGLCRPYPVVLVTDGAESCGGDPAASAAALAAAGFPVYVIAFATTDAATIANLNGIAAAGGTGTAIFVDDETALSTAMSSIVTDSILVEYCNGIDDDCDTLVDEDFPDLGDACTNGLLGACLRPGFRVCTADGLGTMCDAPGATGTGEVCNGIDDDCNGLIDDGIVCAPCTGTEICNGADDDCDGLIDNLPIQGVGDPCGISTGQCNPGTLQCTGGAFDCVGDIGPSSETCNNLDDDCDTIIDGMVQECYTPMFGCTLGVGCDGECRTGFWTCVTGTFGPVCSGEVPPVAEVCNGLDDDCDGATDEDWPELGTICDNGLTGACMTTGVFQCLPDGSGTICTAPTVGGATEVCNGLDDDCDGLIDEPTLPAPIGDSCGGGGSCTPGTLECIGGMIVCTGGSAGTPEVCNGVDDDCDGLIDEPPLSETGGDCTDPGFEMIGDTGTCEFGVIVCVPPGVLECQGYIGPGVEICNGLDDDCDGLADDFAECPVPEDLCYQGACVSLCNTTEFPCPFGFNCMTFPEGNFCVPSLCGGVMCPDGFECDEQTGGCVDRCASVTCLANETCQDGFCLDCFDLGCPVNQLCQLMPEGGLCVPDLCAGVMCATGFFCQQSDGMCVPLVCDPACGLDEVCQGGMCVDNMCDGVTCGEGQVCDPPTGNCVADPCLTTNCPAGEVCLPGTTSCIPDPCLTAGCTEHQVCVVTTEGMSQCVNTPGYDVLASGGGGCDCAVGGTSDDSGRSGMAAGWLLALAGLILLRRRKRP